MILKLISFCGLLSMLAVAFGLSSSRKDIQWKSVINGLILQLTLGAIILKTSVGKYVFQKARDLAIGFLDYTYEGSSFIFGPLSQSKVLEAGFNGPQHGFIFATMVLPTIIFMSSFMAVLYHLGIMQRLVKGTAFFMMKFMKTSDAESLAAAANIFAGQTEAPLVIRPYISKMTKSELLALMTGGMATVAGGVMAAYVGMGIDAGHLLAASVMSAPASLICKDYYARNRKNTNGEHFNFK